MILNRYIISLFFLLLLSPEVKAQEENQAEPLPQMVYTFYKKKQKEFYMGDSIDVIIFPTIYVYPPMKFKSEKELMKYNRLVYNVKKVLPIAKMINKSVLETYEYLETLPNKRARDQHIKNVEKGLVEQYKPQMKKLTFAQGKLLIKLIDRECNQSSFEIIRAFFGPVKSRLSQSFAFLSGASLTKKYDKENDDRLVERVVCLVECGAL